MDALIRERWRYSPAWMTTRLPKEKLMDWNYLVALGLFLDIIGFVVLLKYGASLSTWAGSIDELTGIQGTQEEQEEERLENEAIFRRRRFARSGAYLVVIGFVLQFAGVIGAIVSN